MTDYDPKANNSLAERLSQMSRAKAGRPAKPMLSDIVSARDGSLEPGNAIFSLLGKEGKDTIFSRLGKIKRGRGRRLGKGVRPGPQKRAYWKE